MDSTEPGHEPRPTSGALTKTGGFLQGFTHTLQPYIGCRFGCSYCYVAGSPVHRFHRPAIDWGDYAHPRPGIDESLARELHRHQAKGTLDSLRIFMSSSTDPYQGLERKWRLTRQCLEVMREFSPALLTLQTRSPIVEDDFHLLSRFDSALWLSLTVETDLDHVRANVSPRAPSIQRRIETARRARDAGIQVQIAVSPCLPFSSVEAFGDLLLTIGDRIVVDTFVSGDGSGGQRTAGSSLPHLFSACPDATPQVAHTSWRDERPARALFDYLSSRIGPRAGWSREGFVALTALSKVHHSEYTTAPSPSDGRNA